MLGEHAILEAEKQGATCGICKGKLEYNEHKQALVVKCKTEDRKLLKEYLLRIKDMAIADGYVGFAFMRG